jgi:hypothetical protein
MCTVEGISASNAARSEWGVETCYRVGSWLDCIGGVVFSSVGGVEGDHFTGV